MKKITSLHSPPPILWLVKRRDSSVHEIKLLCCRSRLKDMHAQIQRRSSEHGVSRHHSLSFIIEQNSQPQSNSSDCAFIGKLHYLYQPTAHALRAKGLNHPPPSITKTRKNLEWHSLDSKKGRRTSFMWTVLGIWVSCLFGRLSCYYETDFLSW